jgi:hypothetical protein
MDKLIQTDMRRVQIVKDVKEMKVGEIYELGNNEAWYLVNEGMAEYVTFIETETVPVIEKPKKKKTKEMVARKRKLYVTK